MKFGIKNKVSCLCASVLAFALSFAFVPASYAIDGLAVVDTNRILSESQPGKAGEAHLNKVRNVLQKGLDDLQKIYKGKEKTAEAQNAIRQGYMAVEQQLASERQAVLQILSKALDTAVQEWRKGNKKVQAVVSKQMLLDNDAEIDVTNAVMKEMDKQKPTFPPLPNVQLTPPKKEEVKGKKK